MDRLEGLRLVSWALAAESLLDALADLSEMAADPALDPAKAIWTTKLLADLGAAVFASMPPTFPGHDGESRWWDRMADEMKFFAGTTEQLLDGPVDVMGDRLMLLSATLDPMVEDMIGADEDEQLDVPSAVLLHAATMVSTTAEEISTAASPFAE